MAFYDPSTAKYLNPTVDRRIAVVTGGSGKIGIYTVLNLYLHGYVVYIAGRSETRAFQALNMIRQLAQFKVKRYTPEEKKKRYLGDIKFLKLDLSSFKSIDEALRKFMKETDKVHILINNAGLIGAPLEYTSDDYEIQYQVNVVGPFLLTLKMIPLLNNVISDNIIPRVVNVSSSIYKQVNFYPPNYHFESSKFDFITRFERYSNSKSSLIQLTLQLSKKFPKIFFCSLNPGFIVGTSIYPDNNYYNVLSYPILKLAHLVLGVSHEDGALPSVRGALDETLSLKNNGCYFTTGGEFEELNQTVKNEVTGEMVWKWNYDNFICKGLIGKDLVV